VGLLQSDRATELAAVLSGGPEALLSHTNALRLWKVYGLEDPRPVHVTVPGSGRGRRPGIVFHRVVALAGDECAVVDGIPVTAPGRTIVDAAGLLGSREIETAIAAAEREGLIGSEELAGLSHRYARRRGMALLRSLIAERTDARFTRSEAERRCLDLLRASGLPGPHANVSVGPYELDLFWPDESVAIEIDGWKHHSSRPKFEGDRRKDGWLRARGIEVIRLTWRQITRDAIATAVQVGQTLAVARTRRLGAHAGGGRRDEGGRLDGPRT